MQKKKIIAIILNFLLIILVGLGFSKGITGNMFIYYTNLSNLFALLSSVVMLIYQINNKTDRLPEWTVRFKYVSTCMTSVTILVVIIVLLPIQGVDILYKGNFIYFHVLCPIMMFVSFVFFDAGDTVSKKYILHGIVPTVVYACISVLLNIVGALTGPYPFLLVRSQPVYMSCIWFVVIIGVACIISYLIWKLRKLSRK